MTHCKLGRRYSPITWRTETPHAPGEYSEQFVQLGIDQLRTVAAGGGEIAPAGDYELMQRVGMGFSQILNSLTTVPAEWLRLLRDTGRLVPGGNADFVLLQKDPRLNIAFLASIRVSVRNGKIIFGEFSY